MRGGLNDLAGTRLVTELQRISSDLQQLKERQLVSGRSGLKAYLSQSDDTWDATGTAGPADIHITITFTSDGSQPYPIVVPYADVFINQIDEAHRLSIIQWFLTVSGHAVYLGEFADSGDYVDFLALDSSSALDPGTYQWTADITATTSVQYFFKAYVRGTCPGTVTVITEVL